MKTFRPLLLLPVVLIASCASGGGKKESTAAAAAPAHRTMDERFKGGGNMDPNSFKRDSNGKLSVKDSKRSSFETKGQDPNFSGKDLKNKQYKTGDYAKKSWWGNKDYDAKSYTGNTDGSRFQKASSLQDKGAREANNAAKIPDDYKTGDYATSSAREAGASPIKKTSNDLTENRQKVFKQPEVVDWREQRSMTMDQSKGILGH